MLNQFLEYYLLWSVVLQFLPMHVYTYVYMYVYQSFLYIQLPWHHVHVFFLWYIVFLLWYPRYSMLNQFLPFSIHHSNFVQLYTCSSFLPWQDYYTCVCVYHFLLSNSHRFFALYIVVCLKFVVMYMMGCWFISYDDQLYTCFSCICFCFSSLFIFFFFFFFFFLLDHDSILVVIMSSWSIQHNHFTLICCMLALYIDKILLVHGSCQEDEVALVLISDIWKIAWICDHQVIYCTLSHHHILCIAV